MIDGRRLLTLEQIKAELINCMNYGKGGAFDHVCTICLFPGHEPKHCWLNSQMWQYCKDHSEPEVQTAWEALKKQITEKRKLQRAHNQLELKKRTYAEALELNTRTYNQDTFFRREQEAQRKRSVFQANQDEASNTAKRHRPE